MKAAAVVSAVLLGLVGACLQLPIPVRDRLPPPADGGGGGGGGRGGAGDAGGEGGGLVVVQALPPCEADQTEGCSPVIMLAAGAWHTCALVEGGDVWCWGSNLYGELGDPNLPKLSHYGAHLVPGLGRADLVTASSHATCARVDGKAYCWGRHELGELGTATPTSEPLAGPQRVALPEGAQVSQLAGAGASMCAIVDQREVWCWGRRLNGQPWWGEQHTGVPTPIAGLSDMLSIDRVAIGTYVGCVVTSDGLDVRCWGGTDDATSVGHGSLGVVPVATSVTDDLVVPVEHIAIRGFVCTTAAGQLQCWGDLREHGGDIYTVPTIIAGISGEASSMQLGWKQQCFLWPTKEVACRGYGRYGELGLEGLEGDYVYDLVTMASDAEQLATGWQHNCVLLSNGGVSCWGNNLQGQCNPSPATTFTEPTPVPFAP